MAVFCGSLQHLQILKIVYVVYTQVHCGIYTVSLCSVHPLFPDQYDLNMNSCLQIHLVDDMIQRLQKAGEVPHQCLYEAQILACLQSQCFQKVARYLDDMVKNEHEVASTIEAVHKQVCMEVWDNFLKQAGSWGIVLSP